MCDNEHRRILKILLKEGLYRFIARVVCGILVISYGFKPLVTAEDFT